MKEVVLIIHKCAIHDEILTMVAERVINKD